MWKQALAARFETRVTCLLVETDANASTTQLDRERRTRGPATGNRDIGYHTMASISAAKPGPSASIRPVSPDCGTPLATRLLNITSTAALDRLPN